jgi:hypothetical protein
MRLFGLKLSKGQIQQKYHDRFSKLARKELTLFQMLGAAQDTGDYLELTREGMYYG